ncbi:MAG: hypothetical protein RIS91_1144 [Bacteroidota bacterium]|jgi:membrane protein implicated in regulation of membrane protease activity
MTYRTRYRLTLIAAGFLALVTLLAIGSKMETVATASIAGIMTVLSAYIWSQTTRPSRNEKTSKHTGKQAAAKNRVTATIGERRNRALE